MREPKEIPALSDKRLSRFWAKVDKGASEDSCWIWSGTKDSKGYGRVYLTGTDGKRAAFLAHRISYVISYGGIPAGLCILHRCDNPSCVRPDHLFSGTLDDNNKDCAAKGRTAKGDNHPSRLHPECVARGDLHGSRKHPERLARGDRHYSRTRPELLARGERNALAKLTEADVIDIRVRLASGETQRPLARTFGVCQATISEIARGATWRHVERTPSGPGIASCGVSAGTEVLSIAG